MPKATQLVYSQDVENAPHEPKQIVRGYVKYDLSMSSIMFTNLRSTLSIFRTCTIVKVRNLDISNNTLWLSSLPRYKVGGISPGIVIHRVGKMVGQVLYWSLPVTIARIKNPNMENMASLPFLISLTLSSQMPLDHSKPRGIKVATRVYGVGDLTERSSRNAVTLDECPRGAPKLPIWLKCFEHGSSRGFPNSQDHHRSRLRTDLEPHRLAKLGSVPGKKLGEDTSQSSKH
ncbi:unnamed protein product [Dovyalis caffra]|uniref:Uncharacterized protein n=1 Tax=Dovyalis caffra TaxID=77055 RepID=A0AAV1SDY0_9ROSI|nr:unnamed protein product [Dovyalis caffra]